MTRGLLCLLLLVVPGWTAVARADYTVQGTFLYKDREFGLNGFTGDEPDLPIRSADVEVVDANTQAVLASGATDATGTFLLQVTDSQTRDLSVRVKTSSARTADLFLTVKHMTTGAIYAVAHPTFSNHAPTQNIDFRGTPVVAVQYAGGDPFNIYDTALRGIDFVAALNGARPNASQSLTLEWCSYNDPPCFQKPCLTCYDTGKRSIYLYGSSGDSDGYDDSVILHEFGHYVEFVLAASDNIGGSHAPNQCYDLRLTWSEGYATFFQNMVRDWMGLAHPEYYVDTTGQPNPGHPLLTYEVETPSLGILGSGNEISVNAALWDLYDRVSTNDFRPGDDDPMDISDARARFWNVLTVYLPQPTVSSISIEDFWDGWFARGHGSEAPMRTIFGGRKMEFFDDAFEGDDTFVAARKGGIATGTTHHTIYGAGDLDWTQFDGVAGGSYIFEVRNLPCGSAVELALFDSNGTTPLIVGNPNDPASRIEWTATKNGALYLRAQRKPDIHRYANYDLYVEISVAVTVSDVQVWSAADGVHLTWRATRDGAFSHFDVERAASADGPWRTLNPSPVELGSGETSLVEYVDTTAEPGREYFYRLLGIDLDGTRTAFGPYAITAPAPRQLALHPPQPNPFNPRTQLRFELPRGGPVRLAVYDLRGRLVRTLLAGHVRTAGQQVVPWDGLDDHGVDVASGIYLVQLESDGERRTQRAALLR